jgi:hypothetical protein
MSVKTKAGRPSKYSLDISEQIVGRIENGETLASICREEAMPKRRTVYDWMQADADFSARFARARELGADAIAEDALKIADDGQNDTYTDDNGNERTREDVIQRSKLRVETRLKLLAKWCPKKYGEKVIHDLGAETQDALAGILERVML